MVSVIKMAEVGFKFAKKNVLVLISMLLFVSRLPKH